MIERGDDARTVFERDAGRFDRYWDGWAAQEDAFISREHPAAIADLVIDEN